MLDSPALKAAAIPQRCIAGEACMSALLQARSAQHAPRTLLAAAHPDDETIGAATRLPLLANGELLHITDGAPRNLRDAQASGFASGQAYASSRRAELRDALALAGLPVECAHSLDVPDQEASLHLVAIARALVLRIETRQPQIVLTHPYEGGHPDHDATAFAVHAAVALLRKRGSQAPAILEFASYHDCDGHLETGAFLPARDCAHREIVLTPEQRELKRGLIACFVTQRATLAAFGIDTERYRVAPQYDFTAPPHAGTLHYERFDWGMSGERFRALARAAVHALDLAPAACD